MIAPNITTESAKDANYLLRTANKVPSSKDKNEALVVATNKETVLNSSTESTKDAGLPSTTANKVPSSKDKVAALEVAASKETVPNSTIENAKDAAYFLQMVIPQLLQYTLIIGYVPVRTRLRP